MFTPASAGGVGASSTGVGWDAGAGLALKIDRNSEVFVEGRWIDLGSMNATLILPGRAGAIAASDDQRFGFAVVQAGYAFHF
jgi:opacity protein-like surface antigen